jgi:hypothetical protein
MKNLLSSQNHLRLIIALTFSMFFFVSWGQCPPYEIPIIKTEADFGNKVYIDPSRSSNGNGSLNSPFNTLQGINIQSNTAYLLRRGTVLNERVNKKWNNNMIGAYGNGAKPIVNGGFHVQGDSRNTTFTDLDIRADKYTSSLSSVINFVTSPRSRDITIAYCNIKGVNNRGRGFPHYLIHHGSDNMVVYHNEMSHCTNNGWWLGGFANVRIVRNWIYKVSLDGENKTDNSGDGIQAMYTNHNMYIAGNIIDKSNAIWKYALMLNKKAEYASDNMRVEYNTFIAPRSGNGGAAVFWRPSGGKNNYFRKNVVNSHSHEGRTSLVIPFHTAKDQLYGIRDNHILVPADKNITWPYDIQSSLPKDNRIFNTMSAYSTFLKNNPNIGLYGSDIDVKNFWAPICGGQEQKINTYDVTFKIDSDHGTVIDNAVISFNGKSNPEGNYKFTNVPAGNYEYTIKAPGHNDIAVTGYAIDSNTTISVVMVSIPTRTPTFILSFDVKNKQGTKIQNATVIFDNQPNKMGDLTFIDIVEGTYSYNVTAPGYQPVTVNDLKVSGNKTVEIVMSAISQINLVASPLAGGSVSGQGVYTEGEIVTVSAKPNKDYKFLHWMENGNIVSTQPTLTFIADKSRNLEAGFALEQNIVVITATANPSDYAFVTGTGGYQKNETVRLTAIAADDNYQFAAWMENGKRISTQETYSFVAIENRTLEARFIRVTREFNVNGRGAGVINGNGHYKKGALAELSIALEEDNVFVGWQNINGDIVSTQNPFVFEVSNNVELIAVVKSKVTNEKEFTFSVYPNPSNGTFFINLQQEAELKVINVAGSVIHTQMIPLSNNQIDLTGLPNGVYILSFSTSEKVYTERVIIR